MSCTIASVVPFPIPNIHKPGLIPPYYSIPSGEKGLVLVTVGDGKRAKYLVDEDKWEEMPVPAEQIAQAIVFDYVNEQICIIAGQAEPGIFWRRGEYVPKDFEKQFAGDIVLAKERQKSWFKRLVEIADDDWVTSHKLHRAITDLQRYAARELGLNREWLSTDPGSFIKCPSCMTLVSTEAAVCFACKVVLNEEKYKGFHFAG